MKKQHFLILFATVYLLATFYVAFIPESDAQILKARSSVYKKAVKQKTKELTHKGFCSKGAGTIKLYVTKAINKEFETDKKGETKNSIIYNSSVDPTYIGAENNCRAAARVALAGNIETRVAELVKRSLNSNQISAKSADAINKTVTAGKQLIAQRVSMEDIYSFYREIKDEKDGKTLIEVEFACYYSKRLAMQLAKDVLKKEMEGETEELHKDLDKIFDFNLSL